MQFNLKEAVSVLFNKSVNQFGNAYPNLGAALPLVFGKSFSFDLQGNYAYNNKIFYAATNILVRKMIEAPITFNQKKATAKKFDRFYSKAISNEKRAQIKAQALVEVENHPLNVLFDAPNSYQSGLELTEDFWHNYAHGDGFLWFESLGDELSRSKQPSVVHSLNPQRVQVIESTDRLDRVGKYVYTTWNGVQIELPRENVLHLKHWNPNIGDLKGLGVDKIAAMDISLNNSNNTAQGAAYVNGGRGTLFSSDSTVDSEGNVIEKYDAKQMTVLRETMQRDMVGAMNNRRMYYANGLVNATNYGDTLAEMELINAENANWKSIFAIVGIPVALAPITEAATENNVKAGYKALVTNLVVSELRKFDQKLNQKIQQWWPDIIACHDLTEFTELAPDLELMKNVYGIPTLSEDERRAIFGYDEMENGLGSVYLVPSGLMKLEDLVSNEFDNLPDAKEL